ncbi:MAG: FAD-dependent oxidoreductase, partial [Acidobacteriaceae bacterium]
MQKTAVIIGAGPAGLTAALELLRRSGIRPIVLEATDSIGGISRTIRHHGNRMDIGGHRFFSKSDRVMNWWTELMPVASDDSDADTHAIAYQGKTRTVSTGTARASDLVMLVRPRRSRIYFLRSFFDYPLALNGATIRQLGFRRMAKIGVSYLRAHLFPHRNEKTLEDFLINHFGRELYLTFFKSYTEKVWGVPCNEISAEWGAQRIKGLSLRTALAHFFKKTFTRPKSADIAQKGTETSLIEKFLYPKYGPGQLWEYVADLVTEKGGEVRLGCRVHKLHIEGDRIVSVHATDPHGATHTFPADYVFSTMPVRELIGALDVPVPDDVRQVADGLVYRDFITVGLLVN